MSQKIDLGKIISGDSATWDSFHAARGRAIQAYASLEQSLCSLLAKFGGINESVASVIFFKITSSRARDSILEKLLKKQHGATYSVFWNSVTKRVDRISQDRNQIVHWNAAVVVTDNGLEMQLIPPNHWEFRLDSPVLRVDDLADFITECSFLGQLCNKFRMFLGPELAACLNSEQLQTWTDIFQQPLVYPPPSTHPLCQTTPAPETPPPPSPQSQPPNP